jgi:uncharacterized protein (TIGR02246 family)
VAPVCLLAADRDLSDSAGGYAAFSLMEAGDSVLSVEYKINLLAPARGDLLITRGRVLRAGKTLTVSRVDVAVRRDLSAPANARSRQENMTALSRSRLALSIVVAFSLSAGPTAAAQAGDLSAADEGKIRAVLESYRKAWLANDADGVLRLFTKEAVLLPHHGVEPVVGIEAARAFWFPSGGPATTITDFVLTVDQTGGSCDLAYARGHSRVSWVAGNGPDARKFSNAGTYLTLLRRQADGTWRMTHQMWDDPPPQTR